MTEENHSSRNRKPLVITIIIVAAISLFFAGEWYYGLSHVRTDDAKVAGHITPVAVRVQGYVETVLVEDNQQVAEKDQLVSIDARDLTYRLEQAEARLQALIETAGDTNRVGQLEANIRKAEAGVLSAREQAASAQAEYEKAERDYQRYEALYADGNISAEDLDKSRTAMLSAKAEWTAARKNVDAAADQVLAANAALRSANAKVAGARAQRDEAKLQLSYAEVKAPGNGFVAQKQVEPGQYVVPGQTLMQLVTLDNVWVVANVKETHLHKIKVGDPVTIRIDAYPGLRVQGFVESIGAAAQAEFALFPPENPSGNFTKVVQRIPVKIRFKSLPEHVVPRPGMNVLVNIRNVQPKPGV